MDRTRPVLPGRSVDNRGVSLIIVLWVMSLLMMIVFEFVYAMRAGGGAVRNFKDGTGAHYLALAGVNAAMDEAAGKYDYLRLDEDGRLVFLKKEDGGVRPVESKREFSLGEGTVSYTIEDERGKLNINAAGREAIAGLLKDAGVDGSDRDVIADSILDWRDRNRELHRLNGAKDDYYQALPVPYNAKNGPFDTIEELLLVRGVTPEVFYGTGKVPPDFGVRQGAESGHDYKGLERFVTVYGDDKVDINTAAEEVLRAVFGEGRAQEILLRRSTEGFYQIPVYGGLVSSNVFSIRSIGEVRGLKVRIRAVAERKPGTSVMTVRYWNEEGLSPD